MKEEFVANELKNEIGLAFGQGVMTDMGVNGELVKDCSDQSLSVCTVQKSHRLRFWNATLIEKDRWAGQFSLVYDDLDKKTASDSRVRWISVAAQPIYYFTDRIHLLSVFGLSNVLDDSDGFGTRTLSQISVGPQLTIGKGFFTRPVLRALYTTRSWNKSNQTSFATSSAQGKLDAQSLVAQVEVWF